MFSRIFRFQIFVKTFENLRRPPSLPCGHEMFGRLPSLPCGRVIGEPWKSKLNVKGWPYTYRTWRREMSVTITWIKNHFQNQHPVKNSDPARNFDTGGFRKSQNNIRLNRNKDIKRGSFHCTMWSQSQSWSAQGHILHGKGAPVPIMVNPK